MNIKNLFLLLFLFAVSCQPDEATKPHEGEVELLSLVLEYGNTDYSTSITSSAVTNNKKFPFHAKQVTVRSFKVSSSSFIDISIGQVLDLNGGPHSLTVTGKGGTTKKYSLDLVKDLGLQIKPNFNIEKGSSYKLQSSNVYVDAAQLLKDFDSFHLTGYADFNNDGNTDVLIAGGLFKSLTYSPIWLFLGDGTGFNSDYCECGGECSNFSCSSFSEIEDVLPTAYQGMQHPRKVLIGDYNNDNLPDAFIIGHGYDAPPFPGESPILLLNNGSGFSYQKLTEISGFFHGGSSADFDNDGDLDIFINGASSREETIFLINDGSGNFSPTTEFIDDFFHHDSHYYTSEFIDINSDGFIDLLLAGHEHEGGETVILWGNSSGKYYKDLSSTISQVNGFHIVVDIDAADIDNDGDQDLILNRVDSKNFYQNYYLQILENQGNGVFSDITITSITNNSGPDWYLWVHLQDLNNDGILDLYLERDHFSNLKWFGDGNGNFIKNSSHFF